MQRLALELLHIIRDEKIAPNDKPTKLKIILAGMKLQIETAKQMLRVAQRPMDEKEWRLDLNISDPADEFGDTPICAAARRGDSASLQVLLEEKPDLETKNRTDHTALMISTVDPNNSCFTILLNAGANPNAQSDFEDGRSLLMMTAKYGTPQHVKQLVEKKADVNFKNTKHNTALIIAAGNNKQENIKTLLDHGAAIDTANLDGNTALFFAITGGNPLCVATLLSRGANPSHVNKKGDSPLAVAIDVCKKSSVVANEKKLLENPIAIIAQLLDAEAIPCRDRLKLPDSWKPTLLESLSLSGPKNPHAHFCRGNVAERDEDNAQAIRHYELAGEYAPALRRLGNLLFAKQPAKAKEYYRRAMTLGDPQATAFYNKTWPKPPAYAVSVDAKHSTPISGTQIFQPAAGTAVVTTGATASIVPGPK